MLSEKHELWIESMQSCIQSLKVLVKQLRIEIDKPDIREILDDFMADIAAAEEDLIVLRNKSQENTKEDCVHVWMPNVERWFGHLVCAKCGKKHDPYGHGI